MGLTLLGLFEDLGQFLTPSVVHLRVVALLGLLLGLLTGPVQPPPDDLAHVLEVVGDPEEAADNRADPLGTPKLIVPPVGLGPPFEFRFPLVDLVVAESGLGAGMGLGRQTVRALLGQVEPAVQRSATNTQNPADDGRRLACVHEVDSSATPPFQFCCSSNGSHTYTTSETTELFLWPGGSQ